MASYYCERDVCATKEVLNILSINFNRVLTEIFTKSILNVSTDVEANKLMLFSGFKPFIRKVFTTNDEDIDNLLIFEKKEITQFSFFYYRWYDFFAYFSISQISYLMVKLIAVLKKYRRFNPRNIDLFHFIKSTYFGGRVDIGLVGAFTGKIKMIDVKSEYPLAMTGPLPLINEKYTYIFNLNEEWLNFLNNKIKSALEFREITMLEQNFHKRFKVFEFIDFIGVFMCIVKIPDKEEYASIFSPLPFPERLTKDTRSIRYFTFSQKRILTSVHIASLIYQGWNVEIIYDPNNILFNVLNNEQKNKYKQKFDNIENEINKRFVSMNSTSEFCWLAEYVDIFGKLKANAASNNDEVLKKIYKMLLNATAGRLGMKIVATYEDVEHSFNEFHDTFKVNKRSKKVTLNNSDFYIATFINAYGAFIITSWQYKLQLKSIYNKIPMYERVKTVLYTDTDSIAYNMNEILDEVESSIVYSKDIGNYSIEDKDFNVTFSIKAECNLFIGFAKKSYILADINNAGDWCLHSFMHKGIPANELRKHFLISNHNNAFVINKKLLHETFTSGQALLSYDHIKRITDPNDMSLKTFENITLTKRFNYLTLGLSANSNDQLFNYSFQPLIKLEPCVEDFICDATHSPCSYVKCIYCREFTFHMGSKIVNFNHNYIF